MFADNEMISERQLTVQLMLSFLGPLLLVIPGQKEFGGREGIFGILLGFGAFAIYLFFLLRLQDRDSLFLLIFNNILNTSHSGNQLLNDIVITLSNFITYFFNSVHCTLLCLLRHTNYF